MRRLIAAVLAVVVAAVVGVGIASAVPQLVAAAPATPVTHHRTARVCPDSGRRLVCHVIRQTDPGGPAALARTAVPRGYGPADLRSAYHLSATGSAAETVALIEAYDDPAAESDLATYRSTFGLPACAAADGCFRKVNQSGRVGPLPAGDPGWASETSLDLDMVSAICPGCRILLVEATSPTVVNLGTAVNLAVGSGAKFVSNSYGGAEDGAENVDDTRYYDHPGVVITASTGDDGHAVSYPASGRGVTAVGGTSLTRDDSSRGWAETAWSGGGSGCSATVAAPAFQTAAGTGCARRAVADVAAVADPQTGVAVYQTYGADGWTVDGGTSVGAPVIASVYALAGDPGPTDSPNGYPYAHAGALNDVTTGSNGSCGVPLCTARAGYDGPTGLGTPDGVSAFGPASSAPPTPTPPPIPPTPTPPPVPPTPTPTPSAVTVADPGPQTGTIATAAGLQLSATGGSAPYTWSATGLPPGLVINTHTGVISGAPTTAGASTTTVAARDTAARTGSTTFGWTISAAACAGTGQLLDNPGFESGPTAWTSSAGVIGQTGAGAHTGTWDASLPGSGRGYAGTLLQTVTVPAGCPSYTLAFWLHVDSQETTRAAVDRLRVVVGTTTLATFSNLDRAPGYLRESFHLVGVAGRTVTVRFVATENGARRTSFVVDDTSLTAS